MHSTHKKYVLAGVAIAAVLLATGASAYYVKQGKDLPENTAKVETTSQRTVAATPVAAPQAAPVQQAPACDDNNIVGTAAGAVAGGLIGNQFGKGSGNTLATIGGAAGGAVVGQKYIPANGMTCR